jgi:8-amino-7-oxononanoate synthase
VSRSLQTFVRDKLAEVDRKVARRRLREGRADARSFTHGHRTYVAFASNDYLGLTGDPRVVEAARIGLERGAGALASRLVVGNHEDYAPLERALAELKGAAAACVFGSGYHANLGVIPALAAEPDLVVLDRLSHACLYSGARLSRAEVRVFAHDDAEDLDRILRQRRRHRRHALVLTEGIFSMDGDAADLTALAEVCERHDAWLLVDDAHATGVIGSGAGSTAEAGLDADRVPLQVGTLSKALGSYGGFLASTQDVIDLMITRSRTLIYSTGLPPSVVASARAALEISHAEPWRRDRVRSLACRLATALSLPEPRAAIVPVPVGDSRVALELQAALADRGLWVPAMRPPTVPGGSARLRVSLSAAHTDEDIDLLERALRELRPAGDA